MSSRRVSVFTSIPEDKKRAVLGRDFVRERKKAAEAVSSSKTPSSPSADKVDEDLSDSLAESVAQRDAPVPADIKKKEEPKSKSKKVEKQEQPQEDEEQRERRQRKYLDVLITFLLVVLGLMTRFYSWEFPKEVVFDEQHFGKFASWYLRGEYYVDIHPPFAKLLITLVAKFGGYDGSWDFDATDRLYEGNFYLWLRFLPVFCGSLLPALMYLSARAMRIFPSVAALAGWMVLCDNSVLTETQYILTDGVLFFFDLLTICLTFKANSKTALSPAWFFWMLLTGISLGCATSIKFTAMGVFALVGVHQILVLFRLFSTRSIKTSLFDAFCRGVLLLLPFVVIFFGSFVVHLLWLPYEGDGDAFMTREFRARLLTKNGAQKTPLDDDYEGVIPLTMFQSVKELIKTMHDVNIGLRATHPFSSTWDQWILDQCKALLFWQKNKMGYGSWIYCVGNPVVWIGTALFGVLGWVVVYSLTSFHSLLSLIEYSSLGSDSSTSLFSSVQDEILETQDLILIEKRLNSARKRLQKKSKGSNNTGAPTRSFLGHLKVAFDDHALDSLAIWIGFFANWLPFCLIPRATWNYHYIPALLCSILCLAIVLHIVLEAALQYDDGLLLMLKVLCVIFVFAVGAMWLFLSPWNYGLPLSDEQHSSRFLFKSWHPW